MSIDEPLNVDQRNELCSRMFYARREDETIQELEDEVDKNLLSAALDKLGEREKLIISMRFGLNGAEERTQKEVADILGISQSYISRLEKRIIFRLKKEITKML